MKTLSVVVHIALLHLTGESKGCFNLEARQESPRGGDLHIELNQKCPGYLSVVCAQCIWKVKYGYKRFILYILAV